MSLSVHNHGPALSPEEQARLSPVREKQIAERSGKAGWGIGLTLVQGIVDGHGGSVTGDDGPSGAPS